MSKRLKLFIPILLVLGLVLASGCVPAAHLPALPTGKPSAPTTSEGLGDKWTPSNVSAVVTGEETIDRKIIKTGNITNEAFSRLHGLALAETTEKEELLIVIASKAWRPYPHPKIASRLCSSQ